MLTPGLSGQLKLALMLWLHGCDVAGGGPLKWSGEEVPTAGPLDQQGSWGKRCFQEGTIDAQVPREHRPGMPAAAEHPKLAALLMMPWHLAARLPVPRTGPHSAADVCRQTIW